MMILDMLRERVQEHTLTAEKPEEKPEKERKPVACPVCRTEHLYEDLAARGKV